MQPIKTIKSFDGIIRRKKVLPVAKLEYKADSKKAVVYSSLKMVGVFSIALTLIIGLSSIGSTVSYFSDVEKSIGNRLQAGILALRLSGGYEGEESLTEGLDEHIGSSSFEVNVDEEESGLPMLYKVIGRLDPNNPSGCELMNLKADFGSYHYDGLVPNLTSATTTDLGEWYFLASLPIDGTGLAPNAECKGEIVFRAGLANVGDDITNTFTDEKIYPFEVYNWGGVEEVSQKNNLEVSNFLSVPVPENIKETTEETPSVETDLDPVLPPTPSPAPDLGGNSGGGGSPTPTPTPEPTQEVTPEVIPETPEEVVTPPAPSPVPPSEPEPTPEPESTGDVPPSDIGPPPTEVETETSPTPNVSIDVTE